MSTDSQLLSPLSKTGNVVFEEDIDRKIIIEAYQRDYKIDVSEYFEGLEAVKIYKCLDTGYRFFFPFNLAGNSKLYEKLQEQPWYYGIRWEHILAENLFTPNDLVLEIGAGKGFFLEKIKEKGISCVGLELNEDAVKLLQSKGLNVDNQDIILYAKQFQNKYDIVCSFQVLEHVPNVHDFLKASIEVLRVGGKLVIAVPNSNPFLFENDKYDTLNLPPHHMGLWNLESLSNLQKMFNIRLEKVFVEPLQEHNFEHYFQLKHQALVDKNKFLAKIFELTMLRIKPYRLKRKLRSIYARFVQGRNILVVFTKIS